MEPRAPQGQRSALKGYSLATGTVPAHLAASGAGPSSVSAPSRAAAAGFKPRASAPPAAEASAHFDNWFASQADSAGGAAPEPEQRQEANPQPSRSARNGRGNRIVPLPARGSEAKLAQAPQGRRGAAAQQASAQKRKRDPDVVPGTPLL